MALGNNLKKQTSTGLLSDKEDMNPVNQNATPSDPRVSGSSGDQGKLQEINKEVESSKKESNGILMLIVFTVESEEYAIPIDMVREVVKTPPIAPIPQVPDYIKGVANVRGNVFSILDLGLKMGLSTNVERFPSHLMVIKSEEFSIAIGIDQVPNTLMVKQKEIDYSSEVVLHSTLDESYLKGVVKKDERMIILVDILEMMNTLLTTE